MIQTPRLLLRAPAPSDLPALHTIFSNPEAMRYWSHETHDDIARTERVLDNMIASHADTGLEFVVERDGAVIGKAGLWRIAELGYILHPDHWGQGLAREALGAVIEAAWQTRADIDRITAEIDPRNTASARLLTHLGFHETGRRPRTLHLYGEWCDSTDFALPRPQATAAKEDPVF
ncbi:GNAT family N-acetyltransferase [Aliiroseovarius sp. CAU 1755]